MNSWENGIIHYREGRFAEALEVFRNVRVDEEHRYSLAYYLGLCYSQTGERDKAIEFLQIALEDENDFVKVYQSSMLLSWLKVQNEKFEEAEVIVQNVIDNGFESPQAWAMLGFCCWKRGETEQAIDCYKKALNLDKENANAANGLGYVLADSGIDPYAGVRLCREALERFPENSSYEDSLGWALFKSGRKEEAIIHLERAAARTPQDDVIKFHLQAVKTRAAAY